MPYNKTMSLTAEEIIKKYKSMSTFKLKNKSELETLLVAIKHETCDVSEAKDTIIRGFDDFTKWLATFYKGIVVNKLVTYDELVLFCKEKVFDSIDKFDIYKNDTIADPFIAYCRNNCKNSLIRLNDQLKKRSTISLDAPSDKNSSNESDDDNLYNTISKKIGIDINDEIMLKDIKEKYISRLPVTYQRVISMHFFEGISVTEIAKVFGVSKQCISEKIKRAAKHLASIIDNKSKLILENNESENMSQTKAMNRFQNIFSKYKGKIDIEKELLPYLSDDHKKVFEHYIQSPAKTNGCALSKSLDKADSYAFNVVMSIVNKIEKIIERKQEIAEFINKVGGENGLEDLKLFFNDNEKIYLDKYILSSSPNAYSETCEALNGYSFPSLYVSVNKKINTILEKKQMTKEFIEMNGGEDFLLYDFGSSLTDDQFDVLTNIMMDYHYQYKTDVARELGFQNTNVQFLESTIMKKLDEYYARKKEIDDLIEAAGGVDKVISEIYNKLQKRKRVILMEYTLAYIKPSEDEIAVKIGKDIDYVSRNSEIFMQKLQDMAAVNQKS